MNRRDRPIVSEVRTTPVMCVGAAEIPETLLPATPAWHALASALVDGLASLPGGVRPWMLESEPEAQS